MCASLKNCCNWSFVLLGCRATGEMSLHAMLHASLLGCVMIMMFQEFRSKPVYSSHVSSLLVLLKAWLLILLGISAAWPYVLLVLGACGDHPCGHEETTSKGSSPSPFSVASASHRCGAIISGSIGRDLEYPALSPFQGLDFASENHSRDGSSETIKAESWLAMPPMLTIRAFSLERQSSRVLPVLRTTLATCPLARRGMGVATTADSQRSNRSKPQRQMAPRQQRKRSRQRKRPKRRTKKRKPNFPSLLLGSSSLVQVLHLGLHRPR